MPYKNIYAKEVPFRAPVLPVQWGKFTKTSSVTNGVRIYGSGTGLLSESSPSLLVMTLITLGKKLINIGFHKPGHKFIFCFRNKQTPGTNLYSGSRITTSYSSSSIKDTHK